MVEVDAQVGEQFIGNRTGRVQLVGEPNDVAPPAIPARVLGSAMHSGVQLGVGESERFAERDGVNSPLLFGET